MQYNIDLNSVFTIYFIFDAALAHSYFKWVADETQDTGHVIVTIYNDNNDKRKER